MEVHKAMLGVTDYVIFGLMLMISAGIGVYFRFAGGKQKTTEEYLLAGQNMSILPVAFSLMASFLSAITMIGVPAEMYQFGMHYAFINVGYTIGIVLTAYVTLPVFFELNASTAYEYLEKRFGKLARTLTSITFVVQMILYMSVVLYAPALALSAVTELSTWVSIVSIGVVCTFYCTLGGMKAVLWTDVFQALLMFVGILAVTIKGLSDLGITEVYNKAYYGGRLEFAGFEVNLSKRYTVWNILLQGIAFSMICFGGNQVQVQRLLTVKNISRSRKALYACIPMGLVFHLLTCFAGMIMYAYYASCDPLTAPEHPLSKADQLLPYYMMSSLGQYPGMPGLCICGVFSASLSTVSSAVNSLTAVTMQDLIKPVLEKRGVSEKKLAFCAKAITLFYGFLCVLLTFVVASFGNLVQAALTVFGMLGGPVLAVILLGMLTTRANEKGVIIGLLTSISIGAWVSFGATAYGPPPKLLPVSLEGCSVNGSSPEFSFLLNVTSPASLVSQSTSPLQNLTLSSETDVTETDVFPLYDVSYMWFAPIGLFMGMIVGYVSSIIINLITGATKEVPDELLSPVARYFFSRSHSSTKEKEMKISEPTELQVVNGKEKNGLYTPSIENERL